MQTDRIDHCADPDRTERTAADLVTASMIGAPFRGGLDALKGLIAQRAGSLSGGERQMLVLAQAFLLKPKMLLIDELSLGLAPAVVEELLGVVERLKAAGQTMVIVEQSLNVALAVADRAIFLEKGEVRFEGAARDLLERDDLARAVFFGTEGG